MTGYDVAIAATYLVQALGLVGIFVGMYLLITTRGGAR